MSDEKSCEGCGRTDCPDDPDECSGPLHNEEKSCANCQSFPWCCFYLAVPSEIADAKDMHCPLHQPRTVGEKQTFDDELRRAEAMEKGVDR